MSEPVAALAERAKQAWDKEAHHVYVAACEYFTEATKATSDDD